MNMQHTIKDIATELTAEPVEAIELPQETLGSVLKRTRLSRRLQLADAATRLRFKPGVIEAMESDQFDTLGAPVFVRMYLLRYAQLLDLPEHEVLARYKALGSHEPPPLRINPSIKVEKRSNDLRWLGYPLTFLLLGWLIWTGSQQVSINPLLEKLGLIETQATITPEPDNSIAPSDNTDRSVATAVSELTSPVIATDPAPPIENTEFENSVPSPESETDIIIDDPTELPSAAAILAQSNPIDSPDSSLASSIEDSSPESTEEAVATEAETISPATLNGQHELTLEFSDDCWVEIKDNNGERLVYGILKSGEIRTVSGTAPFSIKLGNAHAARITLDGNTIDKGLYIPRRGSVSQFTLEPPQHN